MPTSPEVFRLPLPTPEIRLGDALHAATQLLRLRECSGCVRRRELFNRIAVGRPKEAHDPA